MRLGHGEKSALPVAAFLLVGFAAPLIAVIWFSFMPPRSFSLAAAPTLENYKTIFEGTNYISFLWSLGLAVLAVGLLALICYPVAYGLVRVFGRWSMLLTLLFTIPLFVSENIRLYGWVLFLIKNGVLLGTLKTFFGVQPESILFTLPAIVLGMVYVYLPLMVLPLFATIDRFDMRLLEAGYDLYAGRWHVLRRIILPIIRPGIIAGSILVFIPCLGAYVTPRILGGGKNMMIGNFIELQFGQGRNWPMGSALSVALLMIVTVALLVYVRTISGERKNG